MANLENDSVQQCQRGGEEMAECRVILRIDDEKVCDIMKRIEHARSEIEECAQELNTIMSAKLSDTLEENESK